MAKYELGYFTDKSIFKYKITKETRNLWKFYLKKGEFEMAKKYCQVIFKKEKFRFCLSIVKAAFILEGQCNPIE